MTAPAGGLQWWTPILMTMSTRLRAFCQAKDLVLEKYEYGSATKNLGFKRWRPDHGIVTEKYEKELEGWEKLLKQISRKGG